MRRMGDQTEADSTPLRVFAAGSLRAAFDALAEHWPGLVEIRYANAGVLAEAIVAGELADVFASASPHEPERLAGLGIAVPGLPFTVSTSVTAGGAPCGCRAVAALLDTADASASGRVSPRRMASDDVPAEDRLRQ